MSPRDGTEGDSAAGSEFVFKPGFIQTVLTGRHEKMKKGRKESRDRTPSVAHVFISSCFPVEKTGRSTRRKKETAAEVAAVIVSSASTADGVKA